ncbi:hypothetical protein [Streptosporangium sp. KLBMP 9127]|nr:hypothetical protein [Streptosporangium sp. KLBMP 9127]
MGKILLGIAIVVVAFMAFGWLLGLLGTLLKWALIIGAVVLVVGAVSRFARTSKD